MVNLTFASVQSSEPGSPSVDAKTLANYNLADKAGVPNLLVIPVGAPYKGISSSMSIKNSIVSKKTYDWMVTLGLFAQGQDAPKDTSVAQYIGAAQGFGASRMWAFNTNFIRGAADASGRFGEAGIVEPSSSGINYELDYSNASGDCYDRNCFTVGLYLHNQGIYTSSAAILLDAHNLSADKSHNMWNNGLSMYGRNLNRTADVNLATNASYALLIGGNHSMALRLNSSSNLNSIYISDPPSGWPSAQHFASKNGFASGVSDVSINTSSPVAFQARGTQVGATYEDL